MQDQARPTRARLPSRSANAKRAGLIRFWYFSPDSVIRRMLTDGSQGTRQESGVLKAIRRNPVPVPFSECWGLEHLETVLGAFNPLKPLTILRLLSERSRISKI